MRPFAVRCQPDSLAIKQWFASLWRLHQQLFRIQDLADGNIQMGQLRFAMQIDDARFRRQRLVSLGLQMTRDLLQSGG